jgi:hypothetical protein
VFDGKKGEKNGITIDGVAKEIRISSPENLKPQPRPESMTTKPSP